MGRDTTRTTRAGGHTRPPALERRGQGRSRHRIKMMLALVVCLAGVLMICYPFVSNLLNQIEQDKICDNQRVAIEALGAEDLSAEREAALDYNERLLHGSVKVVDHSTRATTLLATTSTRAS